MIEVHLIGYTADLKHLVLDVDPDEERGRYRLVVDGDLFATLDDMREQRWGQGMDVGVWEPASESDEAPLVHDGEGEPPLDEHQDEYVDEYEYAGEFEHDGEFEHEGEFEHDEPEAVAEVVEDELADVQDEYEDGGPWLDEALDPADDDDADADDLLLDLTEPEADVPVVRDLAEDEAERTALFDGAEDDELDGDLDELVSHARFDRDGPSVKVLHGHVPDPGDVPEPRDDPEPRAEARIDEDVVVAVGSLSYVEEDLAVPAYEDDDAYDDGYDEDGQDAPADQPSQAVAPQPPPVEASPVPPPSVAPRAAAVPVPNGATSRRALDSDLPTALPSSKRQRVTADGLPIPQDARLSPAQIQAELRKGRSVRVVARDAGTEEAWVRRWLEPIQAEQARIVKQARRLKVAGRKNGPVSALPLEEAVQLRLAKRGAGSEDLSWDAVRRDDGTWRISCRFQEKGRQRTASWLWPRGGDVLKPASDLAREVGWVDRRLVRSR